ncbi:deleted in malignant brain tumors 1 protein-like [Ostrea edulis]|uniref:deleted in malignant brain tumors 1 protein-like n=1 Tax=Ostrea edulis TaxID=37623 RepID=UPI0024AED853|nr:deleted in malignant brain tumors 1 protein-like [Ostrea edulis]
MWDDFDADVVCRQMGFSSGTAIHLPRDQVSNRLVFNVRCSGHETNLMSCPADGFDVGGMCAYYDDAGVNCSSVSNGGQSTVMIGPGGRVLSYTVNGTGTVCADRWDDVDADVVCRQMGFPSGTASFLPRDYMYNRVIFNVRCNGNETQVQQCPVDQWDMFGNCPNLGDAGVNCNNISQSGQGSVTIASGGRVYVSNINGTGTICGDMWDDFDADVVCRQMGFPSGTAIHLPRDQVSNRLVFNVRCSGHETDLMSCPADGFDVGGMCAYYDDAGVNCSSVSNEYLILLYMYFTFFIGGQSTVMIGPGGRVLSYTVNGTGTVCADRWDDVDADVVCRQMGFPSGTASFLPRDYMYNRVIFNVRCNGNETQVQQCPVDQWDMFGNCPYLGDAGVNCNNISQNVHSNIVNKIHFFIDGISLVYKIRATPYVNFVLRMIVTVVGGQGSVTIASGGRVYVSNINGTGTICGDMWDDFDADVVCRQMGFPSGTAIHLPRDQVSNRLVFNVRCSGHETNLMSCPADGFDVGGMCAYSDDAGVNCSSVSNGGQGSVTIASGGRVYVSNINGTGTICGDMWDDFDADVVCRQMGFTSGTAIHLPRDQVSNRLVFNVRCSGHETDLMSCPADGFDVGGMCAYSDDAGVNCSSVSNGGQSTVMIGPGGRVLSYTVNGTGTVCADRWDDVDADVVCRQMGFPSGTASFLPRDYMYNRVIFNVRCNGNETQVQQCPVDQWDMFGNCPYLGDAGVNCNNISQNVHSNIVNKIHFFIDGISLVYKIRATPYVNFVLRMIVTVVGGQGSVTIASGGRVYVSNINGTGTICGDMWDDFDADVVCRQMGFPSGTAIHLPRDQVSNRLVFNVRCSGHETNLMSCPADGFDVGGMCAYSDDAGVNCSSVSNGGQGSVTIASGGRVYVSNINGTGTICGDMWDDFDADVVCRQMGFTSGTAIHLPRDQVSNRLVFNVRCSGHETDLMSCPADGFDVGGMCAYSDDAGVNCSSVSNGGQSTVMIGPGGRVLSYTVNGTGTVCADRWDDVDADVVCRQMGFPSGTASFLPRDYMYNRVIFNVRCNGNETQVQQCPVDQWDMFGNCPYLGDAGVNCNNISQSGQGSVTIASGGRVYVSNINGTGTICGDMWDDFDADVVCRQMGFPSGTAIHLPRDQVSNRLVFNVRCSGHETNLMSCPADGFDVGGMCAYSDDAGVNCSSVSNGKTTHFPFR